MSDMLISIPRLIPKDGEISPGLKYLNLEEKIREYIQHYRVQNLCFLFKPAPDRTEENMWMNNTRDIVGIIAAVRPKDVLVKVINKEFFEKFGGDNLYVRIVSVGDQTSEGVIVEKIIRFECFNKPVSKKK